MGSTDLYSAIIAGGTVYVAQGTYLVTNELVINSDICLQGGFPSNSTGTDLCDYDPIANPTIFDGQSSNRVFLNSVGAVSYTHLTLPTILLV